MGVGESRGDCGAVVGILGHHAECFVVSEEREAGLEDVDEVRLHRHGWAEAPEDPEDDLRQLVHGRSIARVRLGEGWRFQIPQRFSGWALILWGKIFPVRV